MDQENERDEQKEPQCLLQERPGCLLQDQQLEQEKQEVKNEQEEEKGQEQKDDTQPELHQHQQEPPSQQHEYDHQPQQHIHYLQQQQHQQQQQQQWNANMMYSHAYHPNFPIPTNRNNMHMPFPGFQNAAMYQYPRQVGNPPYDTLRRGKWTVGKIHTHKP